VFTVEESVIEDLLQLLTFELLKPFSSSI